MGGCEPVGRPVRWVRVSGCSEQGTDETPETPAETPLQGTGGRAALTMGLNPRLSKDAAWQLKTECIHRVRSMPWSRWPALHDGRGGLQSAGVPFCSQQPAVRVFFSPFAALPPLPLFNHVHAFFTPTDFRFDPHASSILRVRPDGRCTSRCVRAVAGNGEDGAPPDERCELCTA